MPRPTLKRVRHLLDHPAATQPTVVKGSSRNSFQRPDAPRTRLCACTSQRSAFAPFSSPFSRAPAHVPCAGAREDRMRIRANAERPEVHASQDRANPFSVARRPMAMLDQVPTLPARFGVEQAMYCGRYGIGTVSYTAPQPDPRARSKVHAQSATTLGMNLCPARVCQRAQVSGTDVRTSS